MGGSITDVPGVLLGHEHDLRRGSGITVLLFPLGAMGAADIRGEAAGTRQMDSLLRPHPASRIHALVLAGGSAFGLDAAAGVMRLLEERGVGFPTPAGVVPIVPTAVIYDLGFGDPTFRPTPEMAYVAAEKASGTAPERGSAGAGAGATVGEIFGLGRAMKGGVVFAAEEIGGSEGLSLLLAALTDAEEEVRGAAVRALESTLTGTVLKAMVARLPREQGVVLGNLLEALGKSRRRELSPVIERYLDHPDVEVREKAIPAFARVTAGAGWEKILAHVAETEETVRAAAARALGEWSSE